MVRRPWTWSVWTPLFSLTAISMGRRSVMGEFLSRIISLPPLRAQEDAGLHLGYPGLDHKGTRLKHGPRHDQAVGGSSPTAGRALYDDGRSRQACPKRCADTAKVRGEIRYYEAVDTGSESGESGGPEVRFTSVLEAGSSMRMRAQGPRSPLIVAMFALVCAASPAL